MEIFAVTTNKKSQKCFNFQASISEKDRISQLPDRILRKVLSFLPYSDIVRASALSTRWQSLPTLFTVVDLYFDSEKATKKNPTGYFDKFIQTELHDRVRICSLRFKGSVDYVFVNLWVDKLLTRMVEMLHLYIYTQDTYRIPGYYTPKLFRIPETLSNSESLTLLKLETIHSDIENKHSTVVVPDSMCFPRLKTLFLGDLRFEDDHSLRRLLSGCLVLENLVLWDCRWFDTWGCHRTDISRITISISIPSCQKLTISGNLGVQVFVLNLSSLTEAQLYRSYYENYNALTLLAGLLCFKSLRLSSDVLEAISSTKDLLARLPTFHNLTNLEVFGKCCNCAKGAVVCILQKSPDLHSLEIHQSSTPNPCDEEDHMRDRVPQSFNSSIKNFRIEGFGGTEDEIDFLKYMLKNAIHLEKMSISWLSNIPVHKKMQEDISKQLGQLSRGSTNCVIEFFQY